MNTIETIESIRRCNNKCSDYKISQLLGIGRNYISMMINHDRKLTDQQRIKAAKLLNEDPDTHLIYGRIERAKTKEEKRAWEHVLKKVTSTAAALLVAFSATTTPQDAHATTVDNADSVYYVK